MEINIDTKKFNFIFTKYFNDVIIEENQYKKFDTIIDIYIFLFHFYNYIIIKICLYNLKTPVSNEIYNLFRIFNKPTFGNILKTALKLIYTSKDKNKQIIDELTKTVRWESLKLVKDIMLDILKDYGHVRTGATFSLEYFFKLFVEFRNKKSHWIGIIRSKEEYELNDFNKKLIDGLTELLNYLKIIQNDYYYIRNINIIKEENDEDLCIISLLKFNDLIEEVILKESYYKTNFIPKHLYIKYENLYVDLSPFLTYFKKEFYFFVKKTPKSFIYCNFQGSEHKIDYKRKLRTYLFGSSYSDVQKLVDKTKLMVVKSKTNVKGILPNPNYTKFIPRIEYEQDIKKYLNHKNKKYLFVLNGVGGVGKTAIAQKIFLELFNEYETSEYYYDYLVWVSSKSIVLDPIEGRKRITPDFKNLNDILKLIFLVMDIQDNEGYSIEDFIGTLREELESKSLLVVIDDFETINVHEKEKIWNFFDDVFSDINGKLIITTRYRKEVGEKTFTIKGLDLNSSIQFLQSEISNYPNVKLSDENIKKIFSVTQGIPVAMKFVIGQYSITNNLQKILEDFNNFHGEVNQFCFSNLIKSLDSTKLELLYLLNISNDPISIQDIQNLLNYSSEEKLYEDITDLKRYSLLDEEQECFLIVNLVKSFLTKYLELNENEKFNEIYIKYNLYLSKKVNAKSADQDEEDKVIKQISNKTLAGKYQDAFELFISNSKRFENSYYFHYKCITYLQMFKGDDFISNLYEKSFSLMQKNGYNDIELINDIIIFFKYSRSKKDLSKALRYCKIGLELNQTNPDFNYHIGDIYLFFAKQNRDLCKHHTKDIIEKGRLLAKNEEYYQESIKYFNIALKYQELHEYIASIRHGLSKAYFHKKNYKMALENIIIAKKYDDRQKFHLFEKTIRQKLNT